MKYSVQNKPGKVENFGELSKRSADRMAIEKAVEQMGVSEMDAMRHEAMRKRLLSQQWASTTIENLTNNVAKLHAQSPTASENYSSSVETILSQLDTLSAAAEAAAASADVLTVEREEVARETESIAAQVTKEEQEVMALRKMLEKERKLRNQRKQHDALAGVILAWPDMEQGKTDLKEAEKERMLVGKEIEELTKAKELVSKELRLLVHCATGLEVSAGRLSGLVGEGGDGIADDGDTMDTSA